MVLRKFLACTAAAAALVAATGCADGTGEALTPTLPTTNASTLSDGTRLKASVPQPLSPRSSIRVNTLTPALVLENGASTFDSNAQLSYIFELFEGTQLLAKSDPILSSGSQTTWTVPANVLKINRTYSWRAYASYNGVDGSLSDGASFRTPIPPPVDGPVFCAGSTGPAIIGCVGGAYPSRLVSTSAGDGSLERRHHNMEFMRDRIIETGRCKGMDLGRNFKRGTPVISHDFIVWRSDRDRGVDIASGFDDVTKPLKLTWQVFGPDRSYGFPYYAPYPQVDCSGVQ